MKETTTTPGPVTPTPAESPREFFFEWMEEEEGSQLDEDGVPEVVEVFRGASAKIVEPEPGKVLESTVFAWCRDYEDSLYGILDMPGGYYAVRTDVLDAANDGQLYRMRSVVLDEPARPLAWEVLRQDREGVWRPIEGQHLRPRTALAEEWLAEIGPPLTRLTVHERRLIAHWQALGQPPRPGRLREPSVPTTPSLALPALQNAPDQPDLRSLADPKPHEQPDRVMPLTLPAPVRDPGQRWTQPPLQSVVFNLDQELLELADRLREAYALVHYLQQQRGSQVTLLQTSIAERRAELLPTMPPELWLALRRTPGYWMRI